jgi:hypothetical protein
MAVAGARAAAEEFDSSHTAQVSTRTRVIFVSVIVCQNWQEIYILKIMATWFPFSSTPFLG